MHLLKRGLSILICFCLLLNSTLIFASEQLGVSSTSIHEAANDVVNHWAKYQIEKAMEKGYVTGYPDATFKPDKNITRAEIVTLINKAFKKESVQESVYFSDIKGSEWFCKDIAIAKKAGYISGYPDGTFKQTLQRPKLFTRLTSVM